MKKIVLMMKIAMFMSKGLITTVLAMAVFSNSFSQGFYVKEFKQNINDGSAFQAPLDNEGHPCGLIKVRTDDASLRFKGNIVGEVDNKTNEYWVYMASGSRSLTILHPNYLPMSVVFSSFGNDEIASKATYVLTLSEKKFKKEKFGFIATVKPETALLYINDEFIDNQSSNGLYQLYLPKGDYICRFEQKGYRPNVHAVNVGKGTQAINVELESVMAELIVKCKTTTAGIYIDGELKGNGIWSGSVIPGEHQIEARQNNYETARQTIYLSEKETRTISVQELKRTMRQIRIDTKPSNVSVILDGNEVGKSPCVVNVETGEHYVTYKGYGLKPVRSEIKVESDCTKTVEIEIQYKDRGDDYYKKAYNGDLDMILWFANDKNWRGEYEESVFWMERYPQNESILRNWESYWNAQEEKRKDTFYGYWRCEWIKAYSKAGMPEKALMLLPYFKKDAERNGHGFDEAEKMSYIGNGFIMVKNYDKARLYLEKAGEKGYEGMGDYYVAKGNKQLAASYYRKCLNLDYYDGKKRVEKKLKELGY